MKKNLLVTLANGDYIEQSKQLFSSVYHNAGWEGDIMLLSYKIPEPDLAWFRMRGILVYECDDISGLVEASGRWSPVVFQKFNLFKVYFKQWDHIIYLDSDVIVRSSLDRMVETESFGAVKGGHTNLRCAFISKTQAWLENKGTARIDTIVSSYDMKSSVFNSGVFSFSSNLIAEELFDHVVGLQSTYGDLSTCAEEAVLNLVFNNWKEYPAVYNLDPDFFLKTTSLKPVDVDGVILHFIAHKPWDTQNPFFNEWSLYHDKANEVVATKVLPAKILSPSEIEIIIHRLFKNTLKGTYKKSIYHGNILVQKYIGLVGLIIKRISPRVYRLLLTVKNRLS